ncbi:hypothetical protein [Nocardia aurantiaca]|uniref:Uncharacterized protein n=1 Tax=Nocardia aurantiaca TaxID=2675850 RepID=A0A6I3L4S4_9NOCA|nr:hypothetical protein [Nocardia aurantiaca]MTE17352.1 hypothetical protein [Nocardia aurantiaca]
MRQARAIGAGTASRAAPEYQGLGLGTAIVDRLLVWAANRSIPPGRSRGLRRRVG